MSFNLISEISEQDKSLISKYLNNASSDAVCDIDTYLKEWGKQKIKLYKLFGNNLSISFNHKCEISSVRRLNSIREVLCSKNSMRFAELYREAALKYCDSEWESNILMELITPLSIFSTKCPCELKIRRNNKTLQASKGGKIIKTIGSIVTFLSKNNYSSDPKAFIESFETLRVDLSRVTNIKSEEVEVTLSIHPMDFLTASDNDSGWTSCVSLTKKKCGGGGRKAGVVELMNSNNVACCFIKNKKPYSFEGGTWNNKRWRQFIIVDKDIVIGGKAYPYQFSTITKAALLKINELSRCGYTYGPETYLDMCHINSLESMNNNREWVRNQSDFKRNIIIDTKLMYNDFINDNNVAYFCIRNKVKRQKIISISGKHFCTRCGNQIEPEEEMFPENYNDRYENADTLKCSRCTKI